MVGIDLVLISRLKENVGKTSFYNKILNKSEIDYLKNNKRANQNVEAESLAGFFAAKEAILKAFGVGITNGYGFKDITIEHDNFGAPIVILSDKLNILMQNNKKTKINISISHDGDYATAIAVME